MESGTARQSPSLQNTAHPSAQPHRTTTSPHGEEARRAVSNHEGGWHADTSEHPWPPPSFEAPAGHLRMRAEGGCGLWLSGERSSTPEPNCKTRRTAQPTSHAAQQLALMVRRPEGPSRTTRAGGMPLRLSAGGRPVLRGPCGAPQDEGGDKMRLASSQSGTARPSPIAKHGPPLSPPATWHNNQPSW
ncbi:hypothetical protein GGI64_002689 [Rhizobium leguminosarum]|uniref:Uncharacterized protein n=1 Tax=Rhizobium leguminosarum TaxID=384 RepID=A0A7Z0IYB6_RHILE|nr:hypothetical protein [Rhizobium leguminosarum]